ncbi:MAG: hypothetical protein EBS62_08490 [Betaproteobacteria bacterium]|nr:hypothetical protein [Betaproteobacteria bacterium]
MHDGEKACDDVVAQSAHCMALQAARPKLAVLFTYPTRTYESNTDLDQRQFAPTVLSANSRR